MDYLQVFSIVFSFASGGVVLYVSKSLATFLNTLQDKFDQRYVMRNESDLLQAQHGRDHERYDKELDQVWSAVNRARSHHEARVVSDPGVSPRPNDSVQS